MAIQFWLSTQSIKSNIQTFVAIILSTVPLDPFFGLFWLFWLSLEWSIILWNGIAADNISLSSYCINCLVMNAANI